MLQNGIVDAESNESVLMVESANANNGTQWFRGVSATQSCCYFEIPSAPARYAVYYKKMICIFIAFSTFKSDTVRLRRGIINRYRCKYRD